MLVLTWGLQRAYEPYPASGLRRTVSVDWKLSDRPTSAAKSLCDSILGFGLLVSVGDVGVDMPPDGPARLEGSIVSS
jgi:hypothetical protein